MVIRMGKTVLVIDDDDMNLKMAEFILSKKMYGVLKAASGQEGLALLKQEPVDLVLLDIEMPKMNGIEVLQQIRKEETICQVKVIALSALDDEETFQKMQELGTAGYVKKPFMPANLLEQVEAALA